MCRIAFRSRTAERCIGEVATRGRSRPEISWSGDLGRSEAAIAVYDEVVGRYGTAAEAALRELVARAIAAKARLQAKKRQS